MFDRKFGEIKFINKFNLIQKVGVDKSYHFSIHLEKERKIFLRRRNIKNDLFNKTSFSILIYLFHYSSARFQEVESVKMIV